MSWPSIWQNQNQAVQSAQTTTANNMYLTPEQQYVMQQQSIQQWQIYQQQLAQWQAQYGDQINAQALLPNMFMPSMMPPLPIEQTFANNPPPPPPPSDPVQQPTSIPGPSSIKPEMPPTISTVQISAPATVIKPQNFDVAVSQDTFDVKAERFNDNNRQDNQDDGFNSFQNRRNNRNNRDWVQNNRNNNNNNRNPFTNNGNNFNRSNNFQTNRSDSQATNRSDSQATNRSDSQATNRNDSQATTRPDPDVKSKEEIEFDEQYRQWEEQFENWKNENSNHQDKQRYDDFVAQMELCRESMLKKRDFLRQKRLSQFGLGTNQSPFSNTSQMSEGNARDERSQTTASLFNDDSGGGIPGLDLVHGGSTKHEQIDSKAEAKTGSIAAINQLLDDPNLKTLLSDIRRQTQQQTDIKPPDNFNERFQSHESNQLNRSNQLNQSNQSNQSNQLNQSNQPNQSNQQNRSNQPNQPSGSGNPFRNSNFRNTHNDFDQREEDCGERPVKRERKWNDDYMKENNRFKQEIKEEPAEDRMQSQNQSFGAQSFRNNRKRPRDGDQSYFNDFNRNDNDEFRPVQVFDYQNQRQNQQQKLPTFVQQPTFTNSRLIQLQPDEYFPRKVIDYDHKTKTHSFIEFCPIIQMEYDHKRKGFSLHEHPPPKPVVKIERLRENQSHGPRGEFMQLRQQPKWENRQKPWQRYPAPAPYQPKYENERFDYRQNPSSSHAMENQSHYGRNQPERHWQSNAREYNDSRERFPRNTASTSSAQIKVEENPKVDVKTLIFPPGRQTRPRRIAILMRGPPGSGKSFVAKAIKDKESEMNGSARILSIDDYFRAEADEESYEYQAEMEEKYMQFLMKSFKKTLSDGFFELVILDCNNITLQYLHDLHSISLMHQYTPFVCEMPLDEEKCFKNNIHNRTQSDIKKAIFNWVRTPSAYTLLKYDGLFNNANATEAISDDEKTGSFDAISDEEDNGRRSKDCFSDIDDDDDEAGDDYLNEFGVFKSKWDNDTTENKLARLDGTNKPMKHTTIEDYLQMDGWEPPPSSTNGKKRVRWADIEEKREQDKQRAIGFVVGQTNWDNLINQPRDYRDGSTALTKIKYIEKVNKR